MAEQYKSGDALLAFDEEMVVRSWNAAAEQLTGIPAAEAVGRTCWELLGAVDEHGAIVCHAGCSGFRLAREGRPAPTRHVSIRTARGRRHVAMATVANSGTFLHVLTDAPGGPEDEPLVDGELTDRQRQILERIAAGHPAKVIARELGIAEVTVRNHIRAILLSLGCHSQLEAVAEARRRRILA
ncbi:MAG TPA: LuxR C-terminal-related transcriptional regulator [Gaiellaceae bacterium]|nr:LuxR C-terminal-related transcriptional regulator [Gaiellaceae bacterium]